MFGILSVILCSNEREAPSIMGKPVASKSKANAMRKEMPFDGSQASPEKGSPRSWKNKQKSWMMAGLRKLHAPIVSWLKMFPSLSGLAK